MAQFHVGQRVRSLPVLGRHEWTDEGTVTEIIPSVSFYGGATGYRVLCDHHPAPNPLGWLHRAGWLAPLTDPSAERFIESIKKLGREPINEVPKVKA